MASSTGGGVVTVGPGVAGSVTGPGGAAAAAGAGRDQQRRRARWDERADRPGVAGVDRPQLEGGVEGAADRHVEEFVHRISGDGGCDRDRAARGVGDVPVVHGRLLHLVADDEPDVLVLRRPRPA